MIKCNDKTMTKYVIISGVDGSGKTTVINALQKTLEERGKSVSYIWMRYSHYSVKVMNALARVLGLSVKVHNEMGTCGNTDCIRCRGSVNSMCAALILTISSLKGK